jgi:hypothetical protein
MNPIENDVQLTIMVGNRDFRGAVDYILRMPHARSASRGKTRRRRMQMILTLVRAAARVSAARPDAIEIYRAHRPKLTREDALYLRRRLGEDFDVLPVEDESVVDTILLEGDNALDDSDILRASRLPPPPPGSPRRFGYELALEVDGAFDRVVENAFNAEFDAWMEDELPTNPRILLPLARL